MSSTVISLLLSTACLFAFIYLSLSSRRFRGFMMRNFASTKFLLHPTLPGPPMLPYLGAFFSMLDMVETGELHIDFHERLTRYSESDKLLVQNNLFGKLTVVTGDVELTKVILAKGVRSNQLQSFGKDLIKYGLFAMPTDDIWKAHRKGIQPGFGPTHLRHTFKVTNVISGKLVQGIHSTLAAAATDGKPLILNMHDLFSCLTLDVLAQVAFSSDFGALSHMLDHGRYAPEFSYLGEIFPIITKRWAVPEILWKAFGIAESDAAVLRKHVHGYVQKLLADRIERNEVGKSLMESRDLDVMDRLLSKDAAGTNRFSESEIVDELVAFMLAGHDTTANTMSWFLLEHSRNPELAEDLEDEIDVLFAALCVEDKLTLSETAFETLLSHSPRLDMFFNEVQRFHPVVQGVEREINEDSLVLGGHTIRPTPGTLFIASIRGLHFNEKYWKEPTKFEPSRWTEAPVPGSFLPFADGPHNCIGKKMAVIEAMTVLAILIRHFRFKLVPGQHLRGKTAVTTGPRDGLLFEIETR
ncbi:cytochrome P450 [Cladochytrium replicatum]|nr:cytochrome P450 [Cladochytrium replicatum]